MKLAIFNS